MTAHDPRVTLTEAEWREIRVACAPPTDYGHLRDLIERSLSQHVAARLAPIRALVEEWEHESPACDPTWGTCCHVGQLRAALSAHESAPQAGDGAGGHGDDGERAGESDLDAFEYALTLRALRQIKAEAWDEGAKKATPHGGAYLRSLLIENPHREDPR